MFSSSQRTRRTTRMVSKSVVTDIHVILRGYMRRYRMSVTWLISADRGSLTYRGISGMT
jgi:hypothetical protein